MKLYMHPVSTTSRPIRLLIAERKLPVEEHVVDLFTGEHYQAPFVEKNMNRLVPVLEDGDFVLTESQAILQYLADKFEMHDLYPQDLQQRARVNERLDWFNTQFVRDYAYGFCYPQLYPHHKRQTDEAQSKTIEWGRERAQYSLSVLDQRYLGPDRDFVAGDSMSLADYSGACMVTVGEVMRVDLSPYPNVQRWIGRMKELSHWNAINEAHHGFVDAMKGTEFVTL